MLEAERGKREKKRFSSGSFPHPLPSPPTGAKTSPALLQPQEDAAQTPQRCPGHPIEMVTAPPPWALWTSSMAKHHPWCFKPTPWGTNPHNQLLLPGILILSPASSIHSPSGIHYPLQRTEGDHYHLPTPPRYSEHSKGAALEAHFVGGLVSAAEADSAIRLIEKGTRSREQLPMAYVLVRHLLPLIWGLIKANAVMATLTVQ